MSFFSICSSRTAYINLPRADIGDDFDLIEKSEKPFKTWDINAKGVKKVELFQNLKNGVYAKYDFYAMLIMEGGVNRKIPSDSIEGLPINTSLLDIETYIQEPIYFSESDRLKFQVIQGELWYPEQMKGGGTEVHGFEFTALANVEEYRLYSDGKPWETLSRGLNLQGRCRNKSDNRNNSNPCKAYGQFVWIHRGFSQHRNEKKLYFNLGQERGEQAKCPMCSAELQEGIINLAFWDCEYSIQGRMTGHKNQFNKTGTAPLDRFVTFSPVIEDNQKCSWDYANIAIIDKRSDFSISLFSFCDFFKSNYSHSSGDKRCKK